MRERVPLITAQQDTLLCSADLMFLMFAIVWLGNKSRETLVSSCEGAGTWKQVCGVSWAGGHSKSLGGDRDTKVQIQQMEFFFFLSNYRNKVSFVSHLPKNSLSQKMPSHPPASPCLCSMCGQQKRKQEGKGQCPWTFFHGGLQCKTIWRRERQGRRLVASLGCASQGPGWQGLREQGARTSLAA